MARSGRNLCLFLQVCLQISCSWGAFLKKAVKKNLKEGEDLDFISKLKSSGFRVTEPRLRVIDTLKQAGSPMSAKEIYDDISKNVDERVDVATIYRILERFMDLGICHQVGPAGKYMICHHDEANAAVHVILRCTGCMGISESSTPKDVLMPLSWYIQNTEQFQMGRSLLQVEGLCKDCAAPER